MWQGINNITGFKGNKPATVNIAASLPGELNTFMLVSKLTTTAHTENAPRLLQKVSPLSLSVADVTRSFKTGWTSESCGSGWHSRSFAQSMRIPTSRFLQTFQSVPLSVCGSLIFKNPPLCPYQRKRKITCLNDWRPIALTPIISKCFRDSSEIHLLCAACFTWPLQFAYSSNRSTDDAIVFTLHTALSHLENRNTYVRMLIVDYSSAFETIVPATLVAKLQLWDWTDLCAAGSWTSWQAKPGGQNGQQYLISSDPQHWFSWNTRRSHHRGSHMVCSHSCSAEDGHQCLFFWDGWGEFGMQPPDPQILLLLHRGENPEIHLEKHRWQPQSSAKSRANCLPHCWRWASLPPGHLHQAVYKESQEDHQWLQHHIPQSALSAALRKMSPQHSILH